MCARFVACRTMSHCFRRHQSRGGVFPCGGWHEAFGFRGCFSLWANGGSVERGASGRCAVGRFGKALGVGPRCLWWVPRPSAGASSWRHASSSFRGLAWGGRQLLIGSVMGVALAAALALAVALAIRCPTQRANKEVPGL